jgi:tetratricopeptide (TPR) repeat protein
MSRFGGSFAGFCLTFVLSGAISLISYAQIGNVLSPAQKSSLTQEIGRGEIATIGNFVAQHPSGTFQTRSTDQLIVECIALSLGRLTNSPPRGSGGFFYAANRQESNASVGAALQWFKQVVRDFPASAYPRFFLGVAYQVIPVELAGLVSPQQKFDLSIQSHKEAIEQSPGLVAAYFQIGQVANHARAVLSGRLSTDEDARYYSQSVSAYKKAVEIDPSYREAWRELAELYIANDQYVEAIAFLKNALAIQPNDWLTNVLLGESYLDINDVEQAIGSELKAIESSKSAATRCPQCYFVLGQAYEKKNDVRNALASYEQCLRVAPVPSAWAKAQERIRALGR